MVHSNSSRAQDEARPQPEVSQRVPHELAGLLRWPLATGAQGGAVELAPPPEGAVALLLAHWPCSALARTLLHVARSETRAERLARAASSFASECEILLLPAWDCLPYDRASPSRLVMGRRVGVLGPLTEPAPPQGRLVIATIESLLQRVPPPVWRDARFEIRSGQPVEDLRVWLIRAGYVLDERVDEPGEAAIRGEVIDLFPADGEGPFRLELADGRIGQIRRYDPLDQRSTGEAEGLLVGPASEVILAGDAVRDFMGAQQEQPDNEFLVGPAAAPQRVSGLEHRLPLCYERLETLFDYLRDAALSLDPEIDERREAWLGQIADGFEARVMLQRDGRAAGARHLTPLEPRRLYLDEAEWQERVAPRATVAFTDRTGANTVPAHSVPRFAEAVEPTAALAEYVLARQDAGDRILLAAPDRRMQRRLTGLVERRAEASIERLEHWSGIRHLAAGTVAVAPLDLLSGFAVPGVAVITGGDLGLRDRALEASAAAPDYADLSPGELRPGDIVVHAEQGVGRLTGLELVEQGDTQVECLSLEYAAGRKLLVPAAEIDRIWRYGSAASELSLGRLGGGEWQARKAEVEARLEDAAARLLELVRERESTSAPVLAAPPAAYRRFVARFPFTETEDQERAIEATLADIARGAPPMDRLICGDVGYGKTEVALRAACVAALAGKQVAVVAPTTVLVRQHLETFRRRFAGFDVRVEQLSRLSGGPEARAVRAGLADGSVRVVIGTHALASEGVRFADLGLVVIDEEQRFGARQKERLRALRNGVHVLTLTATPIPRTLQAAVAGLIHLSVIATPPVRRRPPRTLVMPFDAVAVRQALRREYQRGGQSFVVCPRIQDLEPIARQLAGLAPELDVVIAHGRMQSAALDEVMVRFASGLHDVLLTTDIVEAGLDIPNANTMLIWRADRFGLAQLHQLRGRVGRGARQAWTYLLTDPDAPLAPATLQRLRTFEALEGLGAGFAVGERDLDLRGAGDLLGADQAGHVRLIGTELFQQLFARALHKARGDPLPDRPSIELHLGVGFVIPQDYVPEPDVRIGLYRRLAALTSEAEVEELGDEITDRFGPPPEPVRHLLELARVRQRCRAAGFARLQAGSKGIAVEFRERDADGCRGIEDPVDSDLQCRGDRTCLQSFDGDA